MSNLMLMVLALCWVTPDHFPPWTSFHSEAPAMLVGVLALITCWRWSKGDVRLSAPIGLFIVLVCTALLQWVGGLLAYGSDVLLVAIYTFTLAAAWLWGYHWTARGNPDSLLDSVCLFFVTVGMLTALQVFAQWLAIENAFGGWILQGLPNARPRANVGQPNQAATIMLMACVAVAVLRLRSRLGSPAMWCAALLLGLAIVLTRSRTALLSAVLMTALYVYWTFGDKTTKLKPGAVLTWTGWLYCVAWALPLMGSASPGGDSFQMASVGTRPLIWKQLMLGVMDSPWVGWGWLQVAMAQQIGALVYPGAEQASFSHNIVLDLLIYLGVPGAGFLFIVVSVWCWYRLGRIQHSHIAKCAVFLLIPFLVHSQLEFPHAYAYFLVVAGLLMGAIDRGTENEKTYTFEVAGSVFASFIVAWTALLFATGYEYTLAEEDFRINRFENRLLGETPADYKPPKLLLLTQLGDILQAMRLRAAPQMAKSDVDLLVRVSKRYSWAPMQFRTALALALNNRHNEATQQLRIIKSLFAEDIYAEARENLKMLQTAKYPQLKGLEIP